MTSGWTAVPGLVPAEIARALAGSASTLNQDAAIWDRPALWTHAKRTVFIELDPRGVAPPTPLRRSAFARSAAARPRRSLGAGGRACGTPSLLRNAYGTRVRSGL